jgi:hypothetical protein
MGSSLFLDEVFSLEVNLSLSFLELPLPLFEVSKLTL